MSSKVSKTTNHRALITGASSGIGLAFAQELAARGYSLVLVSNEKEKIVPLAQNIASLFSVEAIGLYLDLSQPQAAEQLRDYCFEKELPVDILINNAGIFAFEEFACMSDTKIRTFITLHQTTPTLLCRYFGSEMISRRYGYILNVSSLCQGMTYPAIQMYQATKSYTYILSRSLQREFSRYGVSVMTLTPGAVDTPLYNLTAGLRKIAVGAGIMLRAEVLAKRAIDRLLKGRKVYLPGKINYLFLSILCLVPHGIKTRIVYKILDRGK